MTDDDDDAYEGKAAGFARLVIKPPDENIPITLTSAPRRPLWRRAWRALLEGWRTGEWP